MKWFPKLTKEDILSFQKTQDKNIEDKIAITLYDDVAYVAFWELGWGETKKDQKIGLRTEYEFSDFAMKFYEIYGSEKSEWEMTQNYIQFMSQKFGKEYLADMLTHFTGVPSETFLNIIKDTDSSPPADGYKS